MQLAKAVDLERCEDTPDQDRLENMLYALGHLYEALSSLECNL